MYACKYEGKQGSILSWLASKLWWRRAIEADWLAEFLSTAQLRPKENEEEEGEEEEEADFFSARTDAHTCSVCLSVCLCVDWASK